MIQTPKPYLDPQTHREATKAAVSTAMRRAAAQLMENARNTPAPCGCTPHARCDTHCRAKIRQWGRESGHRYWSAACNGKSEDETDERCPYAYDRMVCGDLTTLHDWATDHVQQHRVGGRS